MTDSTDDGYRKPGRGNGVALADEFVFAAIPPNSFLWEFCAYSQGLSQAPLAFPLAAGLAALAQIVPQGTEIRLGSPLTPTFWCLLVGPSGSRKTVAVGHAREIMQEIIPERIGGQPESDAALVEELARNPQQMIFYPEFGAFLSSTAQKHSYKSGLRAKLTEIWDGQPLSKNSKSAGKISMERPLLSVLGAVAPTFIEQHSTIEDWSNGFYPRFSMLYAVGRDDLPLEIKDLPVERQRCKDFLRHLATRRYGIFGGIEADATRYLQQWFGAAKDYWRPVLARHPHLEGFLPRTIATVLRMAMIYAHDTPGSAYLANGGPWTLRISDVRYATKFTELHLFSVMEIASGLALSPHERSRRQILEHLQIAGPQTAPALARALKPRLPKSAFQQTLEALLFEEEVVQTLTPTGVIVFCLPQQFNTTTNAGSDGAIPLDRPHSPIPWED